MGVYFPTIWATPAGWALCRDISTQTAPHRLIESIEDIWTGASERRRLR
jgi:hypothetical protein